MSEGLPQLPPPPPQGQHPDPAKPSEFWAFMSAMGGNIAALLVAAGLIRAESESRWATIIGIVLACLMVVAANSVALWKYITGRTEVKVEAAKAEGAKAAAQASTASLVQIVQQPPAEPPPGATPLRHPDPKRPD